MTESSLRDPLRVAATLGRVAPSPARYARHLSRFNGRAYPKIGVRVIMQAASPFIAGILHCVQDDNLFTVICGAYIDNLLKILK